MREPIKEFVQIVADTLPILEPIYEFGALQVPGQEGFADLRPIFAGKEYVGCDMQEGPGVDRVLNLHEVDLPSETAGTALILETLEHVEFVRKATEEAYRILKPNGILVITSAMKLQIHSYPYDYWRFTPEAFKSLLRPFASSFVDFAGAEEFPHFIVGIGFKGLAPEDKINDFMIKVQNWKKRWRWFESKSLEVYVKSVIPPILLAVYRSIRYRKKR